MFNFTAFIRKKWSEYSTSSGQKGTVIDELAVKPAGLILSDFYNSMVKQHNVNDIVNYKNMTTDDMDFFGNKFFLPRIDGNYSYGYARIGFDTKQTIEITSSTLFVSQDGIQYRAVQPGFINSGSFIGATDNFSLYYVDVQIIAMAKGDMYNIPAGTISQITNVSFTYKYVTNPEDIVNGSQYENNDQYYKRLIYGINDRSMMNKRSLLSKLPEFFPIIQSMYIASAGDKYMVRDFVQGSMIDSADSVVTYLGKTQGSNMITSIAFNQIFPLEAGNINAGYWAPLSIPTNFDYPLSIDPIDVTSPEPAYRGYMLNQECSDDQYKGLFFDDYKTTLEVRTNDLYNIANDQLGFDKIIVPSTDWIYGAHGKGNGDLGQLAAGLSAIDIVNFSNNQVVVAGGMVNNSLSVGKDIKKRIGIKLSGSFVWPVASDLGKSAEKSQIQLMVGGVNGTTVNGYTGVGFGIRMFKTYTPGSIDDPNAVLYFAHAEKNQTVQVFGDEADYTTYGITNTGALGETQFRIEPNAEYEFEFVVYDDLKLTLYLNKTVPTAPIDPHNQENKAYVTLPSTVLGIFHTELNNPNTNHYGTTMKITLDTPSQSSSDQWTITNLKAFDISNKKATALFALNVDSLEEPITISIRANGSSAVNGLLVDGYTAYIWDPQKPSISNSSELTIGAWSEIPELSNSDGSKNSLASLFIYNVNVIDRYSVQNRFGKNIFLMFITSGTTKMNSSYAGDLSDDIHSILDIDYIKAENKNLNVYHSNNKADVYITTLNNSTNQVVYTTTLSKNPTDSYFVMNTDNNCIMPIANIIAIALGQTLTSSQLLGVNDYTVFPDDKLYTGSSSEKLKIILNNSNNNYITVQYTSYPEIQNIQNFFNSNDYGKIYGDILIRHKLPINLSFNIQYTGVTTVTQLIDSIKQYFDINNDGVFVVNDFVSYLYNQSLVNNVQQPINFSYTRYDDNDVLISGEFTDSIEARQIDFFRIASITANKL
jgi:hypothetical protein